MASTEIKNIDSHSHAGLHRSSIRFSPARQYLFFPRTVRGTNCSCIPRSLSLNPSTLAAQESQTQRLFFIWFFLPCATPYSPNPSHYPTYIYAPLPWWQADSTIIPHHRIPSPRESTILPFFLLSFFALLCTCVHVCAHACVYIFCMYVRDHLERGGEREREREREKETHPNVWSRNGIYIID